VVLQAHVECARAQADGHEAPVWERAEGIDLGLLVEISEAADGVYYCVMWYQIKGPMKMLQLVAWLLSYCKRGLLGC
jgi:hypothetical protein